MDTAKKILSSGIFTGIVLGVLLAGVALLIKSLHNSDLKVGVELQKGESSKKKS